MHIFSSSSLLQMELLPSIEAAGELDPLSILDRRSSIITAGSVDLTRHPSWKEQPSHLSLGLHTCESRVFDPFPSGGANFLLRRDHEETRRPSIDLRFGGAAAAATAARRWSSPGLTYEFAAKFPEAAKAAVSRAFIPWEAPLNFTFTPSSSPRGTADIFISMFDGNEDGELAHAYFPPHGGMHFNRRQPWWCNLALPPKHCYDFQSVAVHEIGHLLGLGHSNDPESAMFGFIGLGEVRRGLTRADALALKRLYLLDFNFNFL